MGEKENAKFTIGLLGAIFLIFILADIFTSDRSYSDAKMRALTKKPEFVAADIFSGSLQRQYEEAVADQFPSGDKLARMHNRLERLFGMQEENGVYYGSEGYLFEVHSPESYPEKLQREKLEMLQLLVEDWEADVMLVPTADYIFQEKLPLGAPVFDEAKFLALAKETVGETHFMDVAEGLIPHEDEECYFKTDSHWTALGAGYAFLVWAEHMNKSFYGFDEDSLVTVASDFQGDLHARVPLNKSRDELRVLAGTTEKKVRLFFENGETADTLYNGAALAGSDPYGYFPSFGCGFVRIHPENGRTKKLLLVKGSYANAFIPFLLGSYADIYVVDMKYYDGDITEVLKRYGRASDTDVLVLYDCMEFLDDFSYTR